MSRYFKLHDNVGDYMVLLRTLIDQGRLVPSRVGDTLELEDMTIELMQPQFAAPVGRPSYNKAFGRLEGAQLVAGVSNEDAMRLMVPRIGDFSDFFGSYGPRAQPQLDMLVRTLADDNYTRRAVLTLWSAEQDLPGGHKDHPCTMAITFRVRKGRLNMSVHMRSNDIWRGWAYDAVQFSILQHTLANVLDLEVGTYVHTADSFHVYSADLTQAEAWLAQPIDFHQHPSTIPGAAVSGFGWRGCTLEHAQLEAVRAMTYDEEFTVGDWEDGIVSTDAIILHSALRRKAGSDDAPPADSTPES